MNWLKELVTPKIKEFIGDRRSNISKDMWTKCPECECMLYTNDLKKNLMVCNNCQYHLLLDIKTRLDILFDNCKYEIIPLIMIKDDPLKFKDLKKYTDRLKEAREKTNQQEALISAYGKINNIQAVVLAMNFNFMGGSMGVSVGKSFINTINFAIKKKCPFISVTASGGARMQEGMLSLMQMPATVSAICRLKEAKLPYINIFTHPTTGGVFASFATLGDIHIAEPKALIGFAGARVIEKTIKKTLPNGFQKAEFLQQHGIIDIIVHRKDLKEKLGTVLNYIHNV